MCVCVHLCVCIDLQPNTWLGHMRDVLAKYTLISSKRRYIRQTQSPILTKYTPKYIFSCDFIVYMMAGCLRAYNAELYDRFVFVKHRKFLHIHLLPYLFKFSRQKLKIKIQYKSSNSKEKLRKFPEQLKMQYWQGSSPSSCSLLIQFSL